jgi:hypothetical protein
MAISELRQRIIDIALAESEQGSPPFGKVTDHLSDVTNRNSRFGWQRLKEYFDAAVLGWGPPQWADRTTRPFTINRGTPNEQTFQLTNLQGIQLKGMRVPQDSSSGLGIQWCGIFATWVLFRAFAGGVGIQWKLGAGPVGPFITKVNGFQGVQVGDICVRQGALVHHFIPYAIDTQKGMLQTVNGNSDWQSILKKPLIIKEVAYYYKVNED